MKVYTCTTQEELYAAIKKATAEDVIEIVGDGSYMACDSSQVRACDSAQVRAYDSAQVRAFDSAQVRAYDSAQVTACDSAQVRAYDSAQVRACDSAQVRAFDSAQVTASRNVAVTVAARYGKPTVTGGVVINVQQPATTEEWLDEYGIQPEDGIVTLYKSVDDDYGTGLSRFAGIFYAPGASDIEAPDWNPGPECGGGLHLCPTPGHALAFHDGARFVACPVRVEDIVVHPDASMPAKVKVPRIVGPIVEVDIDGEPVK